MSHDFQLAATSIDYARAHEVRKGGMSTVDKHLGKGVSEVFAKIFDDMMGMPNMSAMNLSKDIGSGKGSSASALSSAVKNSGFGGPTVA